MIGKKSFSSEPEEMSTEEAKTALRASFEHIATMINMVKNSSTETTEKEELVENNEEGPLLTSSPVFPQKLELAGGETTETEMETETEEEGDKIGTLEEQTKQRQNLLLSRPYFLQPNKHKNEYNPSLSTISSHTMVASPEPKSPNLSLTSAASATLVASEATLLGQPSIETDESRTLQHNDTFDNSEMSDFSFDHTIVEE